MRDAATVGAAADLRARGNTLVGTAVLARFALRRERLNVVAWSLGLALLTALVPVSYVEIYPTVEQRQTLAEVMSSPAAIAMMGVNHSPSDYHYGAMTAHQLLFLSTILVAVMSVLMTVRHTRQEEATGRAELLRSSVVGRYAPLAAALISATVANVTVALGLSLGLGWSGAFGIDWGGSWLYGAAHLAVGLSFAAIAALASQLFDSPRAAAGSALALLGLSYLLRGAGDVSGSFLRWLSPLGWAQATQVFVNDHWSPLLIAVAFVLLTVALTISLCAGRDLGAGLRTAGPGPATAGAALTTPVGFAWRLHRGYLSAWAAGSAVMGAMYGAFLNDVESMLTGSDALAQLFGEVGSADMAATFGSVIAGVMAVIMAAYPVLAASRLRSEESAGRAEPLLANALTRWRWVASHASIVAIGSTVVLAVGGLALGATGSIVLGDWSALPRFGAAVLAYAPAHWVIAGLVVALFGLAPRLIPATWGLVGFSFVAIYLGELLRLPPLALSLSPFEHVPSMPLEPFDAAPLLVLVGVASALMAVGLLAFGRRDVPA